MPPKKKAKSNALAVREDVISSLDPSTTGPHELTLDHLARAYGLKSDDGGPARPCPPKATSGKDTTEGRKKSEPEVIVLDSTDEDDEPVVVPGKRPAGKGKGKDKDGCSSENCSSNARCLNWMSQDKWEEDSEKALLAFDKAAGVGHDPTNKRDPELPVGLRNLGATCYVNSFLQVWYQDETFRSGVYACLPPTKGNVDDSPLFQLQVLFAFLQKGDQGVFDPERLVASLKLDTGEQQDAQEFSKLFLNLLDHEFKKQGSRAVREGGLDVAKLVQNQFEGTITYGTRCASCNHSSERRSTFLELELNLTKDCKLEDRIAESLKEESMNGDNKYDCGNCGKKRDATRYSTLDTLPPVLHFSLLRFVFSMKDFSRSKSQHAISYPLKLDMGQFLPANGPGDRPEVWYDLKGVLMHKGSSAHHGHYVAQVHDASKNKWFLFDDETVSSIDDLNAPDRYDAEEDASAKKAKAKAKAPKPKAGFTRTATGEVLPRSKDAYMLVYTRQEETSAVEVPEPSPPSLALARVEELNVKRDAEVRAYHERASVVKTCFEKLRDAKRSVYSVWDPTREDEDTFIVSKGGLRRWIEDGLKPAKPEKSTSKSPVPEVKEHEEPTQMPVLDGNSETAAAMDTSTGDGADDGADDTLEGKLDLNPAKHNEFESLVDRAPSVSPTVVQDDASNSPGGVEASSFDATSDVVDSTDIACPHGMVNPHKAANLKVISQLAVMALHDLGVCLEPEFVVRTDLCRECVWGIASDNFYEEEHVAQVQKYKDASHNGDTYTTWISKTWIVDWLKDKPKMHKAGTLVDPAPDFENWAGDVTCLHGGLQPDEKRRKAVGPAAAAVLKSLFPSWKSLATSDKNCAKCRKDLDLVEGNAAEVAAQLKKEKSTFKSFDNQERLSNMLLTLVSGQDYFIIPRVFTSKWLRWSKANKNASRPPPLDNGVLLCHHGLLLVDIDSEMENPSLVHLATSNEWVLLQANYAAGPPILLLKEKPDDDSVRTFPAICTDCLDSQRQDFSETVVSIKMITASDLDENGDRKRAGSVSSPEVEIVEATSAGSKRAGKSIVTYATRNSKRLRSQPQVLAAKRVRSIEMRKEDMVKDLKIRISHSLNIPTIYQRLFLNGRELDPQETVEELGLYGGMLLELLDVTPEDEDVNLDQLDDVVPDASRGRKKGREEGFGRTGLLGWEIPDAGAQADPMDVDDKQEEEKPVASGSGARDGNSQSPKGRGSERRGAGPAPKENPAKDKVSVGVSCFNCTFLQEAEGDDCTMCGLPLLPL